MSICDGYIRVSQVNGREGDSFISPTAQREAIEGYARSHGHTIGRIFEELDQSGGRADRPLLLEALARQESGEAQVLIVAKLDRFGRSLVDGLAAIERVTEAGGSFVSVADDLDFSSTTGRLVLRLMLSLAEWELDRVRATWADAQQRAVARGVFMGHVPLGYRRTKAGRLVPDAHTAPLARELFKRRAAGESCTDLAAWLTEQRVPTAKGGAQWADNTVAGLIRRRAYLGESRHGLSVNRQAHQPLIDPAIWQAAQQPTLARHGPRPKLDALLRGLVRCSGCGRVMTTRSSERRQLIYICHPPSAGGVCPRPMSVLGQVVEPYAEAVLWGLLKSRGGRRQKAALRGAEKAAAEATDQLTRYRDNPSLPRTLGAERFNAGLAVRVEREGEALVRLAAARQAMETAAPDLADTQRRWPAMSVSQRNQLLASQLTCLVVFPATDHERLLAVPAGQEPTDLPRQGVRGSAKLRPIRRDGDLAEAGPAAGTSDWTEAKTTRELKAFLADREQWPLFTEFQAAGLGLLHANALRHARPHSWARRLEIRPTQHAHQGAHWTEQQVRERLAAASADWDHWPTGQQFREMGLGPLREAVSFHGGGTRWAREMGLPLGPRQGRNHDRWTRETITTAVAVLAEGQDHWPSKAQFMAADQQGLYLAIGHRSGLREQLARELGLKVASGPGGYYRQPGRWTADAVRRELDSFLRGRSLYPTRADFQARGLGGLFQVVGRQPGGHDAVARRYGMKRLRSRLTGARPPSGSVTSA